MKTLNRILCALIGAVLLMPASALAAAGMYLKIGGANGESRIVTCPDGACVIEGLAPGRYSVQVCDAKGVVVSTDLELECSVKSPRDAASGQATGKRQHQPIRISRDTAAGAAPANEFVVTEAGVQVTLKVAGAASASSPAQDHNSTRSNKTSN